MKKLSVVLVLVLFAGLFGLNSCTTSKKTENAVVLSEEQIVDAYVYLLGRALVVRQEQMDFNVPGLDYNKIYYSGFGNSDFVNPNLDCAYNESWIAVDNNSATILEIPEIKGRYFTVQLIDGWGEVIVNINERMDPSHPYGLFAIVLEGSDVEIPAGALKVEVPCKKVKMLARVEVQDTPEEAVRLQNEFKMYVTGDPEVELAIDFPEFLNKELPKHDIFIFADEFLTSSPDTQYALADSIQNIVRQVSKMVLESEANATRVDSLITNKAIPEFMNFAINKAGVKNNGWLATLKAGNYFGDHWTRTAADYVGIWANTPSEVIYFIASQDAEGNTLGDGKSYQFTFSAENLPQNNQDGFWSVTLVDFPGYRVVPNDMKRYNFNKYSKLEYGKDGSLTFYVAPEYNAAWPKSNWLPSPKEGAFNLNFRMYIPKSNVVAGEWFPAALTVIQ